MPEQLSAHFSLSEFVNSQTAARLGIDNTPGQLVVTKLRALCENVLEPIRAHYGQPIHISSGYRCPELNKAVGGAPDSQHVAGEAADIEIPGIKNADLWRWVVDNCKFDQVIAEFMRKDDPGAGWVHVSFRAAGNRHSAISCVKGRYVPGLQMV